MPRRRLAVALLCPPSLAAEVDVLRRAVGVAEPFAVPPHLTLVPPVNVVEDRLVEALGVLRAAASAARPVDLVVGPAATFAPDTPTLHLSVEGGPSESAALADLRRRLRTGPFDRPDAWPFVPHVTLAESVPGGPGGAGLDAAVAVLAGTRTGWRAVAVHLLEEGRRETGERVWRPIHCEPLGGPSVVGRGGVEVVLRTVDLVEPLVAGGLGVAASEFAVRPGPDEAVVVVAEDGPSSGSSPFAPLGVAAGHVGRAAVLEHLVVAEDRRGEGIGSHLLAAWTSAVARRGSELVVAEPNVGAGAGFLLRHGFAVAGDVHLRRL